MSDTEQTRPDEECTPQKIGYGNPPEEHRFKKGQSGNPKGRPKKAKREKPKLDAYADTKMFGKIFRLESKRLLQVKEGNSVTEISVLAAAIRALASSAIKGNRLAGKEFLNLAREVEQTHREAVEEEMVSIRDYRTQYPGAMKEIERQGLSEEVFLHHPDDMFLNPETGEADVNGPMTQAEKEHWDKSLAQRDNFAAEIKSISVAYSSSKTKFEKDWHLHDWHVRQKCFDKLNDNFPRRYRTELVHRSMREGASQPGEQKENYWPGEDD